MRQKIQKFLDKKVYMFAKANYVKGEIRNLYYEHELFIYPFENQEFPEYLGIVPVVEERSSFPEIETLDYNYELYKIKVNRNVEGFIIAQNNNVNKYVRMKNGKLEAHHEQEMIQMTISHIHNIVVNTMQKLESIDFVSLDRRKDNQKLVNEAYNILDSFKDELIREDIKRRHK